MSAVLPAIAFGADTVLARHLPRQQAIRIDTFPGLPRPAEHVLIAIAPDRSRVLQSMGRARRRPEWGAGLAFPESHKIVLQGHSAPSTAGNPARDTSPTSSPIWRCMNISATAGDANPAVVRRRLRLLRRRRGRPRRRPRGECRIGDSRHADPGAEVDSGLTGTALEADAPAMRWRIAPSRTWRPETRETD